MSDMGRFVIVSEMNGKVIDVQGWNPNPGTKVFMWERNNGPNQQWFLGEGGVITSRLKEDMVISAKSDGSTLQPYDAKNTDGHWVFDGAGHICNKHNRNLVLDISGGNMENRAPIIAYPLHGGDNQKWKAVYLQ